MLDYYFESEVRRRQLRRGPLAEHVDGLAAEFRRDSYAKNTARRILSIVGQFNQVAGLRGIAAGDVDEAVVDRFLVDSADGLGDAGHNAMQHLLRRLRQQGVIGPAPPHLHPLRRLRQQGVIGPAPPPLPHPCASTLEKFDDYLRDVRGLTVTTRQGCLHTARAFLDRLREQYGEPAMQRLGGIDVLEFITERLGRCHSRSSRSHLCSTLRGFLRYLHASGASALDLARTVPRVSTPRLATVPRVLPWEQVRALVDGVDTSHPDGLRDKALLLLLATLGLRGAEVRSLELKHIAWRAGEIRIARTKTRRERVLPLVPEVGAALTDYILHGRPTLAVPQVFLRHGPRPRPGPLTSNAVIWIVRRHLDRAGIRVSGGGAHMLRHSLATRMVNAGVPIKAVADVLGHASIDTTAIYTKVDARSLAAVALPFPGGAR
jgi:integrase/recombinase XerD